MSRKSLYKRSKMRVITHPHYAREKTRRKPACAVRNGNGHGDTHQPRNSNAFDRNRKGALLLDQTKLDVHLRENDGERRPSCKPWMTVAVDAKSRQVVGFEISADRPDLKILTRLLTASAHRNGHKSAVERFFSTLNQKLIKKPFGGVRGDREPLAKSQQADSRLTLSELKTLIEEAIDEDNRRKK